MLRYTNWAAGNPEDMIPGDEDIGEPTEILAPGVGAHDPRQCRHYDSGKGKWMASARCLGEASQIAAPGMNKIEAMYCGSFRTVPESVCVANGTK
jgi:hypothetical protein